jgi:hypothetical protein
MQHNKGSGSHDTVTAGFRTVKDSVLSQNGLDTACASKTCCPERLSPEFDYFAVGSARSFQRGPDDAGECLPFMAAHRLP